jgi:hypothetical protein
MAKSPDNRKPETARRRKGFQHAAATARGAVDRIAGKHGFAEADVLLNWPAIAGAELAATCQPVKVSYGPQRTLGATLVVQASSARAPEIEMKGPMIVERVNQYYGYRAITRLRVTQSTGLGAAPAPGFTEAQAAFTGPDAAPTPAEEARAAEMAADIQSPGLRAALSRMGANVLARDRTRTGKTS